MLRESGFLELHFFKSSAGSCSGLEHRKFGYFKEEANLC